MNWFPSDGCDVSINDCEKFLKLVILEVVDVDCDSGRKCKTIISDCKNLLLPDLTSRYSYLLKFYVKKTYRLTNHIFNIIINLAHPA